MANKTKRMDQIRQIISVYLQTGKRRETARKAGLSRNTVRRYLQKFDSSGLTYEQVQSMSDQELSTIFYGHGSNAADDRQVYFRDQVDTWLNELRRVGVTRYLLWEEYKVEMPAGYGYSQFCERLKKEIVRRDLTICLDHNPGEVVMVDFAGSKISWIDIRLGEIHLCEVLVAVMPHSQFTFAIAVASQCIADFISAINAAFLFFDGIPKVLLSDNLRSYVTRANRYEPTFTQLCEQMAAHYGIDMQATRVRKPQDKASVENSVTNIYRKLYAPLRNEEFHSMEEINEAFKKQLGILNEKLYQKKTRLSSGDFRYL